MPPSFRFDRGDRMTGFVRVAARALAASWLVLPAVSAAVGGSDAGGCYEYSDTIAPTDANAPVYAFEDISATGTVFQLGDEHMSGAIPLGFGFNFYGRAYAGVHVGSNGFLTFLPNQDTGCCSGPFIPGASEPNAFIAGLWDDLLPLPSSLFHETRGTSPSRRFIVQFTGVPRCCNAGNDPATWQVVLFEGTNEIVVQYENALGFSYTTAGIENADGSDGIQWRRGTAFSFVNTAVRYFPTGGGDADGDGAVACIDNCPLDPNSDQADADSNGVGDACNDADDADGDEIDDALDNCPGLANTDQADGDDDGLGDACDTCTDSDGDGFGNPGLPANLCPDDNCPFTANPGQEDADDDGIGDACIICSALGTTGNWGLIAREKLTVKSGVTPYGYVRFGSYMHGPVCTTQAKLATTNIYANDGQFDPLLVATKSTGTAIVFRGPGGGDTYGHPYNRVDGTIATGGGLVKDIWQDHPLEVYGAIDTTGSNPGVAACAQAMADSVAASQALAALPPTQTLGRVDVKLGQEFDIDAHGGGVVNIEALRLEGALLGVEGGYGIKWCTGDPDPASLNINANPGDQVVLNVGLLKVGNCASLDLNSEATVVINVPGPGRKVQVGVQADACCDGWPILAPERAVVVRGSGDDTSTYMDLLWSRKVLFRGYVSQYNFSPMPLCGS
jgi:hypothetical protein